MTNPQDILRQARRIAVVGCSATPGKYAHDVPAYLLAHVYDVVPVNPTAREIFGRVCYPDLASVPGPVDLVNVFRPSEETPTVVQQAIQAGAKAVWLQLGIAHPESRRLAEAAGLPYVEDRCTKIEHARMARQSR